MRSGTIQTSTASYVYAVTRPFDAGRLASARGVGGHPVHLVVEGDLAAAVSTVPLSEFDEAALKERLEDQAWLEETVRAHHAIVDAVARIAVAMPFRLSTLYLDDDRVRAVLRANGEGFDAVLARLDGRVEWGVKVYTDPNRAGAQPDQTAPSRSDRSEANDNPGRAYLKRRQEQRRGREDAWRAAADLVERLEERLRGLAEASERHRPQDAGLSGVPGENVLNAAYLVEGGEPSERFLQAVRDFEHGLAAGVRIELSGPWAPYSFAQGSVTQDTAVQGSAVQGSGPQDSVDPLIPADSGELA